MVAVYPGSFDPLTLGHVDIIDRASRLFSDVVVALSETTRTKRFSFSTEERLAMIERVIDPYPNVKVVSFGGLLTHFARSIRATVLIRGLRAISDFEYEFQMASMNHTLAPDVETVFMMTATKYSYLSSSIVKEIASLGGNIAHLVPDAIHDQIVGRLGPKS
ncbi:MAG: pantetheine-phosphate adenylyltransferase [Candidatus Riflebacteria bacterium]|nr:pantetheine-phosphate adenylyltransferase [Candidatus Riflebacteria bacterium]